MKRPARRNNPIACKGNTLLQWDLTISLGKLPFKHFRMWPSPRHLRIRVQSSATERVKDVSSGLVGVGVIKESFQKHLEIGDG